MADPASTGTLVVVALSGGAGALLGAILGQAVQLHRDRKRYEREDARHERERREALDDARATRREERYGAALTATAELRMQALQCTILVRQWHDLLHLTQVPEAADRARPMLADLLSVRTEQQAWLMDSLRGARSAANAAYSIASAPVREACVSLATQPLLFRPVVLTERGPVWPPDTPSTIARSQAATPAYAEASLKELSELIARCDQLDGLMRAELGLT